MNLFDNRVVRAVLGLIVLAILGLVVRGYINDYRDESSGEGVGSTTPAESTVTAPPQAQGEEPASAESPSTESAESSDVVLVLIDGLNLRREARGDSGTLGGLEEGDRLKLVGRTEGWYEVETTEGTRGFVSANPSYVRIEE